jgi:hypothetical protein
MQRQMEGLVDIDDKDQGGHLPQSPARRRHAGQGNPVMREEVKWKRRARTYAALEAEESD